MAENNSKNQNSTSFFQRLGLLLAGVFYVFAIIYVHFLGENEAALVPGVKRITLAHWQLEDGFREGYEEMITSFEALKGHDFELYQDLFEKRRAISFMNLMEEFIWMEADQDEPAFVQFRQGFGQIGQLDYDIVNFICEQVSDPNMSERIPENFKSETDNQAKIFNVIASLVNHFLAGDNAEKFVNRIESFIKTTDAKQNWTDAMIKYARENTEPIKVDVVQSTVPYRPYGQWLLTQLIGGKPADIIELKGSSHLYHQYFYALSPYLGYENVYNRGTVLEGLAWKDCFIDGLESNFDNTYHDYFGIGAYFHVYRMFTNLDLLEKATGSRKPPETFNEWIDDIEAINAYSKQIGRPIIPIGVRGFDKATLLRLYADYYSQLNGHLTDIADPFYEANAKRENMLRMYQRDANSAARMLAVMELIRDLGQGFGEGYSAMDLEETKFQFYAQRTVFFYEGSWNGYSLVKNCPVPVGISRLPYIGQENKFAQWFTGQISEMGAGLGGKFGIPKRTPNFELTLDLLKYMSSYEMNQMTMVRAKWPPVVKEARFEGLLEYFEPYTKGNLHVTRPFEYTFTGPTGTKLVQALENIIDTNADNPQAEFQERFVGYRDDYLYELQTTHRNMQRTRITSEMQRSQLSLAMTAGDLNSQMKEQLTLRKYLSDESYANQLNNRMSTELEQVLQDFTPQPPELLKVQE